MKLALAGGGTGGHISPGIALLEFLTQKEKESEVMFLTSSRSRQIVKDDIPNCRWVQISAATLSPRKFWRWPEALVKNLVGYRQSYLALKKFKPEAIFGLGGYVSAPPIVAAVRQGIAVVLCEQNTVVGRANAFLSRWAAQVALGFPLVNNIFPQGRTVLTGNPLRKDIRQSAPPGTLSDWGLEDGRFTILVMGGSRGARFINRLLIESIPFFREKKNQIQIIHLSGEEDKDKVSQAYSGAGLRAKVFSSWDKMGWVYSQADLLVARGGAATLTEAAFWGLPSIIIPYLWATDEHQLANARYFEKSGAALVFEQNLVSPSELVEAVLNLKESRKNLEDMSEKAKNLFIPNAEESILNLIREAIKERD